MDGFDLFVAVIGYGTSRAERFSNGGLGWARGARFGFLVTLDVHVMVLGFVSTAVAH